VSEPGSDEPSAATSVAREIQAYINDVRQNRVHTLCSDLQVLYASGSPACEAVGKCLERSLRSRLRPPVVVADITSRREILRLTDPMNGCSAVSVIVVERDDVASLCCRLGLVLTARQGWVLVAALSRLGSPSELVAVPPFVKDGDVPPWKS
jgi:hypothetical protein